MREETGTHLDYLDGWRGLAVGLVVLGHFWGDAHIWVGMSKFGVALFFVLSGRLMAEILFVRRTRLPTFFIRRFSRVYPALFVYVLTMAVVFSQTSYAHKLLATVSALTFTINYAMIYVHPVAMLDHLWSLCVEEHGYVILAGIAFLGRRTTLPVGIVIAGLGFAAMANGMFRTTVLHQDFFFVHWRSDVAIAPIFLSGALWLWVREARVPAWLSPAALAGAVVFNVLPYEVTNFGLSTLCLALAVTTIDKSLPAFRAVLAFPGIRYVGLLSYSLYLWQQPFYHLHRDGSAPAFWLVAAAFILALTSFYAIERPARYAINRLSDHLARTPERTGTAA